MEVWAQSWEWQPTHLAIQAKKQFIYLDFIH